MRFSEVLEVISEDLRNVEAALKENTWSDVALIPLVSNYLSGTGGKRIRPILVLVSSKLCNYWGDKSIIHSCIVEFIHTATLLHDDVVDGSSLRRGHPSANAKWGNEASVLVGDFLFSKSFTLMSNHSDFRIMRSLSKASLCMAEGEVMQLVSHCNPASTESHYLEVIKRKTAALIASCCQIGAILGEAPPEQEKALVDFGLKLGMAFQLVDDVLDYSAKEVRLGKRIGKDFHEGNVTLPLISLYTRCREEERAWIDQHLGKGDLGPEELEQLLGWMRNYCALESATELARGLIAQAKERLSVFEGSLYLEALRSVADYICERDY
ncbi:MAG: polyprenyl synthetase family protein [Candidatus Tectomicrobia bacterium]|uniref:Polyprenyl synthetase family protein n=1 Tax=Tectimicrobiota bacterium TaxID=2528274 RepID=A0A932CRR2_UNCTE|nr:polyprenyl synthetase family protein [Candidatus Tectomicrobia bacterium]